MRTEVSVPSGRGSGSASPPGVEQDLRLSPKISAVQLLEKPMLLSPDHIITSLNTPEKMR